MGYLSKLKKFLVKKNGIEVTAYKVTLILE